MSAVTSTRGKEAVVSRRKQGPMNPADAKDVLLRTVASFPGLIDDTIEVNGADLVEWMTNEVYHFKAHSQAAELLDFAKHGTPEPWKRPASCTCNAGPATYMVRVTVKQVSRFLSDADDQKDQPQGKYAYHVMAANPGDAESVALDRLHDEVPIGCLDDFEITAEVLP